MSLLENHNQKNHNQKNHNDSYEIALSDMLSDATDNTDNVFISPKNVNVHILSFFDPLDCPLYDHIKFGEKTVEGRKYSPRYQNIKVNDIILLSYKKKGILECKVTYIHLYNDVNEYINSEGLKPVFGESTKCRNITSIKDGIKLYDEFIKSTDVAKLKHTYGYGFMGIGIKFIHEYKRHFHSLYEPWFSAIISKRKIIIAKINNGWVKNVQPCDMIEFTKIDNDNRRDNNTTFDLNGFARTQSQKLNILVTDTKKYKNFVDMFNENGIENIFPGKIAYDEGLSILRTLNKNSKENEEKFGVIAIFFTILSYK